MRRKIMTLVLAVILLVAVASTSAAGAKTLLRASMGFSAMPEPARLVVIGVCLIGLSLLVRRGVSGKRS